MPEYLVHSLFGITGVRTWKELQGIPCIEFEDGFEAKQSIYVFRSVEQPKTIRNIQT